MAAALEGRNTAGGKAGSERKESIADVGKELGDIYDVDDAVLRAQGHVSELQRSFSWLGGIGLCFSITNSWATYASCFGLVLAYGGGQMAVFGLILGAATQWIVLLGLAELSSALPSSGGQYHFTYILAPPRFRNFAAYSVGILNILGWWLNTASGTIFVAISAFGIGTFWYPDFAGQKWQVYLCYLLVIILSLIPIFTVRQKHLDRMTQISLYCSIVGFILVTIIVLVMGRGQYNPSSLVSNQGISGWGLGPAWLMSIGIGQYPFFGTGACTHVAEEIPRPGRKLPLIINLTMVIGVLTSLPWILAATSVIIDMNAVQTSFLPSLEVFYQATGSKSVATFLQAYLTFIYYTSVPSQWITCSRITWAFSRDNGLPFSNYWNHINERLDIPVRTTLLSAGFCAIYGLLYITSTAAWNSIINTAIVVLNITFTVPQGILATRGRGHLPKRPFNLGKFGYAINVFSVLWLIISGIFFCFPATNPTTKDSMNYGSVVIVGLFVIVMLLWIERRNKFQGPAIDWEALNANNAME